MLNQASQKLECQKHGDEPRHVHDEIQQAMPMKNRFISELFSAFGILGANRLPLVQSSSPSLRTVSLLGVKVNG